MRTHAAGTFAMNCAFHGIPCIGYRGLDTQELLHINTTVDVGDLYEAKKIILRLKEDTYFYRECSVNSQIAFKKFYTEEKWKESFNNETN